MTGGTEVYIVDANPVIARGVTYDDSELDEALGGPVAGALWDNAGTTSLNDILAGLSSTEFEDQNINRILSVTTTPQDWQVGEALAQCFLTEHRECQFPWNAQRDLKNPSASAAGCDLVGFQLVSNDPDSHRFAFGEVKTSTEEKWPPGVWSGEHGLRKQLEGLRDSTSVKDALVKYLGHHAKGSDWLSLFQTAAKRYISSPSDVSLFGMLIRDVTPRPEDLARRAQDLAEHCPNDTSIELRAMYLPIKCIDTMPQRAMRLRGVDHAQE